MQNFEAKYLNNFLTLNSFSSEEKGQFGKHWSFIFWIDTDINDAMADS